MAQFTFRLNVTAAQFPFISTQAGASVIVKNQDTYYATPNAFSGETADKNLGIPQMTFCENVMPVSYGIQSVGFDEATEPFADGEQQGDQLFYLISSIGTRYLANLNRQNGKVFIYSPELTAWVLVFQVVPGIPFEASVAIVKGRCFLYVRGMNSLAEFVGFNTLTNTFSVIFLNPTAIADMSVFQCIVGANNYLILATTDALYYTIPDATVASTPDFTPSLGPTGAATEIPSVLRGLILICHPIPDGFMIFTTTSIVAAYYSNNIRFPWSYRELDGSAPITSLDAIGLDREGYPRYAYTTGGLLKLGKSSCTPQLQEATEFFGGAQYEYYDWATHSILTRITEDPINVGVAYIGGRWVVLSYGAVGESFTHAIVWDEHLRRWGKIAIAHVRAIEFFGVPSEAQGTIGSTYQDLLDANLTYQDLLDANVTYADLGGTGFIGNPDLGLQYKSLGFMTSTGIVQLVNFDLANQGNGTSVAMIGRIQLTRGHRFKITDVWTENLNPGLITVPSNLAIIATKDMQNTRKIVSGYLRSAENSMVYYQFANCEGVNHTLRYEGDFDLSTVVVRGKQTGTI